MHTTRCDVMSSGSGDVYERLSWTELMLCIMRKQSYVTMTPSKRQNSFFNDYKQLKSDFVEPLLLPGSVQMLFIVYLGFCEGWGGECQKHEV